MTEAASERPSRILRLLPWACFGLLALPFHPLWVDFEQVRRGLLLLFTGAVLVAWPRLPHVRGERIANVFVLAMVLCAVLQAALQALSTDENAPWSFQAWLAAYRIGHWLALLVIVRLGATATPKNAATPLATVLALTGAFGLLQHLGIAAIDTYGLAREPVSTLGNLNVASEWTAVAAIGVAVLLPTATTNVQRVLLPGALVIAAAYLVINQSRSGLIALPCGLLLLALLRRRQRGWLPFALAAGGALFGLVVGMASPRPGPTDQIAMRDELERGTVTLAIRFEIARGATQLFAESPIYGRGPGQFQIHYPRHRSQDEIEASSFGRQFPTEVRNAHNDWLELLVDGGLPALLLFAAMLFALQRGNRDKARLLPLFVLMLLMLVRAPLFNAPAMAAAFWLVGTPADRAPPRRAWTRALPVIAGIVMLLLGLLPVAGNQSFAPYLRAQRDGEQPSVAAASTAAWWMPYEPRWLEVEARELLYAKHFENAEATARHALELRPFAPQLYLLLGEVLARRGDWGQAFQAAKQGLRFDSNNPELSVLKSVVHAQLGDVDRAITSVCDRPHPVLRAQLANHFADLARRANKRRESQAALRYLAEHHFLSLLDRLGTSEPAVLEQLGEHFTDLRQSIVGGDRVGVDARVFVAGALYALELDKPLLAEKFGEQANERGVRLTGWQRALIEQHLDALREFAAWRRYFGAG